MRCTEQQFVDCMSSPIQTNDRLLGSFSIELIQNGISYATTGLFCPVCIELPKLFHKINLTMQTRRHRFQQQRGTNQTQDLNINSNSIFASKLHNASPL